MNAAAWPWEARHGGHLAFYLRAFVPRDWMPGRPVVTNYICYPGGELPEHAESLACATCGNPIGVGDIEIGDRLVEKWEPRLAPYRNGAQKWPPTGTRPNGEGCWICNESAVLSGKEMSHARVAAADGLTIVSAEMIGTKSRKLSPRARVALADPKIKTVRICERCEKLVP